LWSNDFAPPLSPQQVVSFSQSSCVSPVALTDRRGWGRSQIILPRECPVLYNSFITLCGGGENCTYIYVAVTGDHTERGRQREYSHRADRVPGFLSGCLNWLLPPPLPQASGAPPWFRGGGGNTRRGGWGANSDEGTDTLVF
jgi:hypothetical protein